MRIAVTGERGYLSSKISDFLVKGGHDVIRMSVRSDEFDDISDREVVIHVAGITNAEDPRDFYTVNSDKTEKLFDYAEKNKIKHFIYISSMSVYGTQTQKNDDNPITLKTQTDACTDYGKSKLLAEQKIISASNHTKWTILRVPSLYDENKMEYFQNYKDIVKRLPIIIYSSYSSKRSLLCIDNLCVLLGEIVENEEEKYTNKILLPSDAIIPDFNELIKKTMKDMRIRKCSIYLPKFILNIFIKIVPRLSVLYFNAYYGKEDCKELSEKSYHDFKIN